MALASGTAPPAAWSAQRVERLPVCTQWPPQSYAGPPAAGAKEPAAGRHTHFCGLHDAAAETGQQSEAARAVDMACAALATAAIAARRAERAPLRHPDTRSLGTPRRARAGTMAETLTHRATLKGHRGWVTAIATPLDPTADILLSASR